MDCWICVTCGTQFPQSDTPPDGCPICLDKRQYVGHEGQKWTTLPSMQKDGHRNTFVEHEPRLTSIGTTPSFAIAQRAYLVQTERGNVLWDCISFIDDETAARVEQLGGIAAIAISHPHFYSSMIEWAERFDAPILLHEANRAWVMRPDERITFWSNDTFPLLDDIQLVRLGGHFPGSSVLHWPGGAGGKGVLLTGDTIMAVPDRNWVSFMYSYPNLIPLPASEIRRMRDAIAPYPFERLYSSWLERVVSADASNAVKRSAERYLSALERNLS